MKRRELFAAALALPVVWSAGAPQNANESCYKKTILSLSYAQHDGGFSYVYSSRAAYWQQTSLVGARIRVPILDCGDPCDSYAWWVPPGAKPEKIPTRMIRDAYGLVWVVFEGESGLFARTGGDLAMIVVREAVAPA